MYVRKLRKPSPNKNVYKFASIKNNAVVMCESHLEFICCFFLEFSPDIECYESQPEGFYYLFNGKECPYTPDFLVTLISGEQKYIEVKPILKILKEDVRKRFEEKRKFANDSGIELLLVTDEQLNRNNIFDNLKILYRQESLNEELDICKNVINLILNKGTAEVEDISTNSGLDEKMVYGIILSLIKNNKVNVDISKSLISYSSKVSIGGLDNFESVNLHDDFESFINNKHSYQKKYDELNKVNVVERDLDSFPDNLKKEALEKFKLYSLIDNDLRKGWTQKNLEPLIDTHIHNVDIEKPSWRSLARWHKAFNESEGDLKVFVKHNHLKGNRARKVINDTEFFDEALAKYLDAKRPSVMAAYRYYKDSIVLKNEKLTENKIQIISYTAFNKRIKALPPYQVAVQRHGKYIADQWFNFCSSFKRPTRILERVEIDHTPLDVILLDDKLEIPIGRPYLTLLTDVYSGCIIGFHLSYRSPGYTSVAKAIIHSMKPKNYFDQFEKPPENKWPCQGKIETLVVDNGAEFWSDSLEHALAESKIHIQYNPVRKPWLKPFIESLYDVINNSFLTWIPGKTFCNIIKKEEYKPEKDAVMRFSAFNEEFHRWIVDIYHQDSDSRQNRIPIDLWEKSAAILPPINIPDEELDKLVIIMGLKKERALTSDGFVYKGICYDSPALEDYRKQYPQTKKSKKKIIKIDPDDLSHAYIFLDKLNDGNGGYLEVKAVDADGYTNKLSLHEHLMLRKVHLIYIGEKITLEGLARARMYIHERIKSEYENLNGKNSKEKAISAKKKQSQLQGISNEGKGTIKIDEPVPSLKKETKQNKNLFDEWDSL